MANGDLREVTFNERVESSQEDMYADRAITGDFLEGESPEDFLDEERPRTASGKPRIPSTVGRARLGRTPASGRESLGTLMSSYDEDGSDQDSVLITEVKDNMAVPIDTRETSVIWDELDIISEGKKRRSQEEESSGDDDADYDTDLDVEEKLPDHDPTGRTEYLQICERLGVVPVSYFAKHITDPLIRMRYHGLGGRGARAIAKCLKNNVTCEKLDLSSNWIGEDGGCHMSKLIKENDFITELYLADNRLGHGGAQHFCRLLHENATLRALDLSGNDFTDKEAELFAEAFEENKYLKHINLSRNYFGELAGEILGPAIASNDILETLDLSWNQIRQRGAVAFAKGLKENIRIKVCNLAWNGFGPEGGVALADAIVSNEALTELDVSGNRIDSYACELIGKAVARNELIKVLKMGSNPVSTSSLVVFLNAIKKSDITVLEHLDLSEVPVAYEYLRTVFEIKDIRPEFVEVHGPVMRSGNTQEDVGKPSIDPKILTNPLVVLRDHIVVNDVRILEVLQNYDKDHTYHVTQDQFASALKDLGVPFDTQQLGDLATRLGDKDGNIFYGDILKQLEGRKIKKPTDDTDIPDFSLEA